MRSTAVIAILVGLTGLFAFEYWMALLSPLSADGQIQPYTWLMLRIMLIALIVPGIILIAAPHLKSPIRRVQQWFDRLTERQYLVYTIGISLAARVLWAVIAPMRLFVDWAEYDELAWRLAQTGELTATGGFLTTYRPPGYPFFLSMIYRMFGHTPKAGAAANILLGLGIIYLTYLLARRFFGERTARWAALLLAIFPSQVLFINTICSEVLFTFLLLLGLYFFTREDKKSPQIIFGIALAGIIWGLAALVRPLALLLPLVLIPWWQSGANRWRRTLLHTAIALAGIAIVVTPWVARNHNVNGRATIATNGGVNFYIGNNPTTTFGFNVPATDLSKVSSAAGEAESDRLGYQWGWEHIKHSPLGFVKRGLMKIAFMMTSDTEGWAYELIRVDNPYALSRDVWLGVLFQTYYFGFLLMFLLGLREYCGVTRWDGPKAWPLFGLIGYWLAVHFVFFGNDRFHYPIVPIMALFAALALKTMGEPGSASQETADR